MSTWSTLWLVMERELRARRRAALIVTAVLATVAVGALVLISVAGSGSGPARLQPEDADEVLGSLGVIIMFAAILMTGQVVLLGVAEEKNSRVAEVVLGAMPPRLLLAGKVIAIGLIGLAEVVLTAGLVLGVGSALDTLELPDATGGAFAIVLLWFLLGFAFYSTVYGAAGSLVARHQNAANAAGPINIVVMIGYFIGVFSVSSDLSGNVVLKIASILPPFAPTTMPLRMIQGTAAPLEVAISIVLLVVSTYGLLLVAERVYSGGLLSSGKTRIRTALRNAIR